MRGQSRPWVEPTSSTFLLRDGRCATTILLQVDKQDETHLLPQAHKKDPAGGSLQVTGVTFPLCLQQLSLPVRPGHLAMNMSIPHLACWLCTWRILRKGKGSYVHHFTLWRPLTLTSVQTCSSLNILIISLSLLKIIQPAKVYSDMAWQHRS